LGTLHGPGSLPGWTFVQLDFDINVYKCKCCKLRTSIKKRARGQTFLKFKAGEPDEASDAKRACTDNEDNKCFF
jgi:hypothetical protein